MHAAMVCMKNRQCTSMNDQDTPSKRRRREHSPMFKRESVARSLVPGASVAAVALEAGINSNLLFAWRRMQLRAQEQAG